MNARSIGCMALFLALTLVHAGTASAGWKHDRKGFTLGFNVGMGSAGPQWAIDGNPIESDRSGGGVLNLRIGGGISQSVVLAFELSGWHQDTNWAIGNQTVRTDVSFGVVGPAVTWFPGGGGFYLRGTVGVGLIGFRFDLGAPALEASETGVGFLAATGYEWRLTRTFALGTQLEFGAVNVGDVEFVLNDTEDLRGNYINFTLGFNWYL